MNGAELAIRTALGAGIDVCFANPGTTEMPLVMALEAVPEVRSVLSLHENICTGAADGYARIAGKPALTLLHLGPGLANGTANLHNARRARMPVVNLIGEHATWHADADAPLAMDIDGLARTFSRWVDRVITAEETGRRTATAIEAAWSGVGGISTLILPHDLQLEETSGAIPNVGRGMAPAVDPGGIAEAAELLRGQGTKALFLGGAALHGEGLRLAGRIAAKTGATLLSEVGFARMDQGLGLPVVERLPYLPEQAQACLDRFGVVVGIGAKNPVSFFGWPGKPSRYLQGRTGVVWACDVQEDAIGALRMLCDALGATVDGPGATADPIPQPTGALDPAKLAAVLASRQPDNAIVIPTAVTSAAPYSAIAHRARPHSQLVLTGGAIGEGQALAVGAAIAAPDRKVINLEADGSGAYAFQALWTQAREQLDVLTIICSNRAYKILQVEIERAGQPGDGPVVRNLTSLDNPPIGWVAIAQGLGVPASSARTAEELGQAIDRALATPGPALIEAVL